MKNKLVIRSWLEVLSETCTNISSAFLIVPFVGTTISFPKSLLDLLVLTVNFVLGIVFMLIAVWLKGKNQYD